MQDRAREIEDGPERRPRLAREPLGARPDETRLIETGLRVAGATAQGCAQGGELGARRFRYQGSAVAGGELRDCFELEQPVESRDRATRGSRRIQHGGHRPDEKRGKIAAIMLRGTPPRGSAKKGLEV